MWLHLRCYMKVMDLLQWYSANTHSVFIHDIQQPTYILKRTTFRIWRVFSGFQTLSALSTPFLDRQGETHDVYINILSQGWKPQHWHSEKWTQHILCLTMLHVLFSQDVFRRGSWKGKGGNVRWPAVYPLYASIWGQEHFFCVHVPRPTPPPLASGHSKNCRKVYTSGIKVQSQR